MAEQTSQQGSQETVAKDKDQKQRQPKKMVSSTVKDVISKGRTMTGKKPDQIDLNPVKENTDLFKQIADIYDRFFEAADRSDTYKREWGTDSLTNIYKKDTPGQNINKNFIKILGKGKEAVSRSEYERNEIDLVPRDQNANRKEDSEFFRQQSITKRRKDIGEDINDAFSEAYGKGYKSPWDKIEKAKPGIGKRIDAAAAGLKQNAADYQAIIDKEKKQTKNESVNAAGAGTVRGFGSVSGNPDGSDIGNSYVNANIADADTKDNIIKAQVKAHADLHMVGKDNSTDKKVAKEEVDLGETSKSLMNRYTAKLILKHPDVVSSHPVGRDVQRKKSLNLAMDKLIPSSAIKKPKVSATEETVKEDLRQWFKDKWVRMDTKGNIKGDCAREPGEGKPKCLPVAKARAMDKEDRAAAARRKRREDPVADRPGKGGAPINVRTEAVSPAQQAAIAISLIKAGKKKGKDPGPQKEEVEHLEEKNKPTNPALWSRAKSLARSKFDVYPSAYANGWAAKWYKSHGGGWKSVSEETLDELSNELIGRVNKERTLTDRKSKTPTAAETLNKAVEKVRRRTEVGKIK